MKILFFTQNNCVPCRRVKPVMKDIAEEYGIDVDELDINLHRKTTNEFNIMSTPTLIVLDDEGLEVNRVTGAKPKRDMVDALELVKREEWAPGTEVKGVVTSHQIKKDDKKWGTI